MEFKFVFQFILNISSVSLLHIFVYVRLILNKYIYHMNISLMLQCSILCYFYFAKKKSGEN